MQLITKHYYLYDNYSLKQKLTGTFQILSFNRLFIVLCFSKIWNVKYNEIDIYYTLCGYLHEEICGTASAAACLKNKEYVHVVGKQFILGMKWTFT